MADAFDTWRAAQCGEWSPSGALRCVLGVSHADEHLFGERPTEPRTWSLPPEPGPDVTAVRDRDGRIWLRQDEETRKRWFGWERADKKARSDWKSLMRFESPLTDATGEVQP